MTRASGDVVEVDGRLYAFARGRTHFGAMIFACAAGLLVLVAAAPLFRHSDIAVAAAKPQTSARTSALPILTVARPKPDDIDSAWVSQSPAPAISVGEDATLTFRFRNTGRVAWRRGTVSEASLALTGDDRRFDPRMAVDWPTPSRPATQMEDEVAPGALATFTFRVRGIAPGMYHIDLRPTISNVGWLRAEGVYVEVTVR